LLVSQRWGNELAVDSTNTKPFYKSRKHYHALIETQISALIKQSLLYSNTLN